MKQRIFNSGHGWYISATNYRDEKDKTYINLFFPKKSDPEYIPSEKGYSVIDIDIQEARFTSYNGKAGLTIFKYSPIEEYTEPVNDVQIDSEELPFY